MNRTLLVLALALFGCAGCRSMGPKCGQACGGPGCDSCCEPCHVATMNHAPRPGGCCEGCCEQCGRGGNMESDCPGGQGCLFDKYHGQADCGYPCSDYDCSPCGSPDWGCTGHGHPFGYVNGAECLRCSNDRCDRQQYCCCPRCGKHYCRVCGPPGPGCGCCPFCGCGPSGDQNYNFNPGPPVAQTAYPYYTLRGPRDFLMSNPPSIGPY